MFKIGLKRLAKPSKYAVPWIPIAKGLGSKNNPCTEYTNQSINPVNDNAAKAGVSFIILKVEFKFLLKNGSILFWILFTKALFPKAS